MPRNYGELHAGEAALRLMRQTRCERPMMRYLFTAAAACLALAAPARAEWREASSDHFVVYADASEGWLKRYADKLERFDAAMRFLRKIPDSEDERSNRLVIYVLPNAARAAELCGKRCGNVVGFYLPRAGGSIAYTIRGEGAGAADMKADTVLFHEYTHHFLLANVPFAYPLWLGEGLAEFHGTSVVTEKGAVQVGLPPQYRGAGLMIGNPIPIEQLFAPTAKPGDGQFWDVFYGRSWLLTHMLTFGERSAQFPVYLRLIDEGKSSLDAARTAFGDLKLLDREMNSAVGKQFRGAVISADKLKVAAVTTRTLTPGEAAMMPVRLKSDRGVNRAEALALLPEARRRAAPFPNEAAVQTALAEAEYDAGNDAEAEAAVDRALAADPKSREALMYKGRVAMRKLVTAKSFDAAAWQRARRWFIRANALDPNAAEPLMLNYQTYLAANEKPTANAVAGLERAFDLSRQDTSLRFNLAMQRLRDNQPAAARALLQPIATNPHSGKPTRAAAVIAAIDAGNAADARKAAQAGAEEETE